MFVRAVNVRTTRVGFMLVAVKVSQLQAKTEQNRRSNETLRSEVNSR
jgi:hypothetical protein